MAGILPRAAIPVAPHAQQLPGDLKACHLLYCS
jgi:hypothetical protein